PRRHSRSNVLKRNARGMGTTHAAWKGSSCNAMLNVRGRNACDAGDARRHHAGPRLRAPHLECGDIERRLEFTPEKTQPTSPSYRRKKERIVQPRTPMEAFERVRRRDAALAARRAADRTATAAVARIEEIATEFTRKWDRLIPPRQSSPSE